MRRPGPWDRLPGLRLTTTWVLVPRSRLCDGLHGPCLGDDLVEHLFLGQPGGIDDVRVPGDRQRPDGPRGVAMVSCLNLIQKFLDVNDLAAGAQLGGPTAGALLGGGVEVE